MPIEKFLQFNKIHAVSILLNVLYSYEGPNMLSLPWSSIFPNALPFLWQYQKTYSFSLHSLWLSNFSWAVEYNFYLSYQNHLENILANNFPTPIGKKKWEIVFSEEAPNMIVFLMKAPAVRNCWVKLCYQIALISVFTIDSSSLR